MKLLSSRGRPVARSAANIADAQNRGRFFAPVARQLTTLKLTPRAALIAALFCVAVWIGQPTTAGEWVRAIIAGVLAVGFPFVLAKFASGEWSGP